MTGGALARGLRERVVEPYAIRAAANRAARGLLRVRLDDTESGDSEFGDRLLAGALRLVGQDAIISNPASIWAVKPPSPQWLEAAHRFVWLADLAAVGEGGGAMASEATLAWIHRYARAYDPVAWNKDVAAERLLHWISQAILIAPDLARVGRRAAGGDEIEGLSPGSGIFLSAISQHEEWLTLQIARSDPGLERLRVVSAVTMAALALHGSPKKVEAVGGLLENALAVSLRPDGGVLGRRPDEVHAALSLLLRLQTAYEATNLPEPTFLEEAIAKLAAVLRFFRMGDGGVPMFHSGRAIDDGRVDLALANAPFDGKILKALPDSGYGRINGGRVIVIMDSGRAAKGSHAETAHASCLAFEMSSGRRRVVVNCGAGVALESDWRSVLRGSEAHSTLIVDGVSSAQPRLSGRWRAFGDDKAFVGPPETHAERKEERNGVWIVGAHDAYFDQYGLTLTRRMFLSVDGGDFRGEDSLSAADEGARIFERRLAANRRTGVPFAARFHLHPDVEAEVVAEGEAITLRLPHGEVWVMRQAGGKLALEPSVYVPKDAPLRPGVQIVISAFAKKRQEQLRWAFRRVGEASQLPLDVEALIAAAEKDPFADGSDLKLLPAPRKR
ncbi:MAG: heparinase II/III family protein [Rhodobacteraceae bacterium]|nr:heparinase II/III family protein [Paracoccaceae bacterium]